jgi:hypothetical protein
MGPLLPYQRLLRRIEASADLVSLVAAAKACGPGGIDFLVSRIRRMARGAGGTPADALSMPDAGVSDVTGVFHSPDALRPSC